LAFPPLISQNFITLHQVSIMQAWLPQYQLKEMPENFEQLPVALDAA
jgi:hypothetical protein